MSWLSSLFKDKDDGRAEREAQMRREQGEMQKRLEDAMKLQAREGAEARKLLAKAQKVEAAKQSDIIGEIKKKAVDTANVSLGGFFGYRSLLSGRKGGGGFSDGRSLLDGLSGY